MKRQIEKSYLWITLGLVASLSIKLFDVHVIDGLWSYAYLVGLLSVLILLVLDKIIKSDTYFLFSIERKLIVFVIFILGFVCGDVVVFYIRG